MTLTDSLIKSGFDAERLDRLSPRFATTWSRAGFTVPR